MKAYLLSPPAIDGIKMVREGRCMAREGVWTTLWPPISMAMIAIGVGTKRLCGKDHRRLCRRDR